MDEQEGISRILRASRMFGSLEPEQLAAVSAISRLHRVGRGQRLFDQGQPCQGMFVIGAGRVKLFKVSPEGREHLLHMVGPGDTFAEAALFGGFEYPASAEAAGRGEIVLVPRRPFLELLADHPAISLKLLAGLSAWLRRLVDLLEDIVLRDALGKLAKHILSLKRPGAPARGPAPGRLVVQMTLKHQELASHLGITRETVSRTLARLESLGLIVLLPKGQVRIVDRGGLARLAGQ